jgi:hypothetical protein
MLVTKIFQKTLLTTTLIQIIKTVFHKPITKIFKEIIHQIKTINYAQNNNVFDESNGSVVMKTVVKFLIVIVVLCGVGYGVNYTKNYFAAMPEQRIKDALDGNKTIATEQTAQQKPWFWDFFRKEPNANEVFEKYEKETMVEGQNVAFQTMNMKGKLTFIPHNPNSPITKLKPLHKFNMEMEMSMKLPDKVLVKMNMTLKPPTIEETFAMAPMQQEKMNQAIQSFRATVIAGVNGQEKWAVNNVSFNGTNKTEEKNENNDFDELIGKTNNLTMTFSRQMYERIEFVGTDNVEGRKTYLLKGIKPDTNADLLYFDIETGLVIKYFSKSSEVLINGYNTFEGVKMPSSMRVKTIADMDFQIDVHELRKDILLDDSIFLRSSY